jgi:Outer membrane protein beta-barrel domain
MPDNLFDKQAQDALKNLKVNFNPDDWAKMETLLDKQNPKVPFYFNWKYIGVAVSILVLFSIGGYYLLQNVNSSGQKDPGPFQNANAIEDSPSNTVHNSIPDNGSPEMPVVENDEVISQNEPVKPKNENLNTQKIGRQDISSDRQNVQDSPEGNSINQILNVQANTMMADHENQIQWNVIGPNTSIGKSFASETENQEKIILSFEPKSQLTYSVHDIQYNAIRHSALIPEKERIKKTLFYVGAQISPALVILNRVATGFEGGLVAGMHWGKVISVESGIFYSRLNVNKDYSEIQNTYELTNIKGTLQYINIPVQAYYSRRICSRLKIFGKVGVSNLFTIKEELSYTYIQHPSGSGQQQALSTPIVVSTVYSPGPGLFEAFSLDASYNSASAFGNQTGITKRYQLLGRLGAGFEYGINQKASFRLSLDYQFPISGITVENLKTNVLGIGLGWKQVIGKI